MYIAVVGTAGRDKERRPLMTRALYERMYLRALQELQSLCPDESYKLVSGAAAWSDHLAVTLLHRGKAESLRLHLPCRWDYSTSSFLDEGFKSPGSTANYYHGLFSKAVGANSLASLERALEDPRCSYTVSNGFLERNILVGQCDALIAFTWGPGAAPADGGTSHCWKNSCARQKVHVPLESLL